MHNAAENIFTVLNSLGEDYEVIFIDDGSTDRSFNILKEIYTRYPHVTIIKLSKNFGQHLALLSGFESAQGDVLITVDADLKVRPSYIPQVLQKMKDGYDVVICWRAVRPGLSFVRRMGSFLVNAYTNFITGAQLHDHGCSLKAYRRKLVMENIHRPEIRGFFSILVTRYARKVSEIRVVCPDKRDKESNYSFKSLIFLAFDFLWSSLNILKAKASYRVQEILTSR